MLNGIAPARLVGLWFVAVSVLAAGVVTMGVNVTASTAALLLTMCLVPPAILLAVWRGAPPPTVGELLYAVSETKEGRP
jgi:hypothetical protein